MLRKPLSNSELTGRIIAEALDVHKELGPGFIEGVYEEALCIALEEADIPFERQKPVDVRFRGRVVGRHRLDLFVASVAVVELKAVKEIQDVHFAITRSYMKALNTTTGLILNFAAMPLTIRRVARAPLSSGDAQCD